MAELFKHLPFFRQFALSTLLLQGLYGGRLFVISVVTLNAFIMLVDDKTNAEGAEVVDRRLFVISVVTLNAFIMLVDDKTNAEGAEVGCRTADLFVIGRIKPNDVAFSAPLCRTADLISQQNATLFKPTSWI